MRTMLLSLGLLLLVAACGSQTAPRALDPAAPATVAAQAVEPGRQLRPVDVVAPASSGPQVIPDGFPLAAGYPGPERSEPGPGLGLEQPNRTSPPLELTPCDVPVPLPAHTDLLRAGWTGPEDFRARQLVTFAGPAAATAYVDTVVAAHAACPEHVEADGVSGSRNTVTATGLGDQGAAVSTQYTFDGLVTPGLTTLHVVRVGSAVLLAVTSNEGGAGPDPRAQVAAQVADGAEAVAGVVDTLCEL